MLDKIKEFKPSSWAIDNKMTVYLITIFICVAGIMAYNSLPKENFPDITVPTIYVNTINWGNSPTNIENTITKPIEKRLKGVSGFYKSWNMPSVTASFLSGCGERHTPHRSLPAIFESFQAAPVADPANQHQLHQ